MESAPVPSDFVLYQNHPNPFNPSTTIEFAVPTDCSVRITVYNAFGQEVAVLMDAQANAGRNRVVWNSQGSGNLPSGIYTYRMHAKTADGREYLDAKKMVLIK